MPARWCNSSELRKHQIESGLDLTFNEVFTPLFEAKVVDFCPSSVLEVGAGTGHMARNIASLGYKVTAIEPSKGMFSIASQVLYGSSAKVINCSADELPYDDLFDLAYSHLVVHVIDDLISFFTSIRRHLHPGGQFIFSLPHPCFYNGYKGLFGSEYEYIKPMIKNVEFTITKDPSNKISGVPYHHRPLSAYINGAISAGFQMNYLEEIMPSAEIQAKYGTPWKEPRYCVFSVSAGGL